MPKKGAVSLPVGKRRASDPLATIKCALEMKKRHYSPDIVDKVIFKTPEEFLKQCPNFKLGD